MSSPESECPGVVGGCGELFKSRFPVSSQSSPSSQSFLPCLLPSLPTVGAGVTSLLSSLTKPPQAAPPVPLQRQLSFLELVEKLHFCPGLDYFHLSIKSSAHLRMYETPGNCN